MSVLLAKKFDPTRHDVNGWMASEKLDGMRAYWNGRILVTRNGKPIHAPAWFTAGLPANVQLDGELFIARGEFQATVSVCRKKTPDAGWKKITYKVFDAPDAYGTFRERYSIMLNLDLPAHVEIVEHVTINSAEEGAALLQDYENLGGEGVMLRDPESLYERKRSSTLLKVKSFMDSDATILGHLDGAGKHAGRLGSLLCEMDDGTEFSVGIGLTDQEREHPPAIGERITFSYFELTRDGVPRFPAYIGVRCD